MADIMTVEQRSRIMARNRGKDTSPERYLASLLIAGGLSFDRHDKSLPGCPDFVFNATKTAVFVDGDFWHGWRFPEWSHRMAPFWREKIGKTRLGDRRNHRRLRGLGWTVVRIWEHQVETDLIACIRLIAEKARQTVNWLAVENEQVTMPRLKRRKRLPKP